MDQETVEGRWLTSRSKRPLKRRLSYVGGTDEERRSPLTDMSARLSTA
jgi:hypothetical protein